MARSYFSRLVRGGGSAPLTPQRPVSNLWKTAQIDAAAVAPDSESLAPNPRSAIQRSRVAETVPSLNAAEVESRRPAPQLRSAESPPRSSQSSSPSQASQTSLTGETLRPTPTAATSARTDTNRRDMAGPIKKVQAPEPAAATSPARSVSARREPSMQRSSSPPDARFIEAKPATEARLPNASEPAPISDRAQPNDAAGASRTARALSTPTPIAEAASPALRPQERLQPMESATPGFREPSRRARQSSISEEPREKTNTVQIGKIEVQVLPPPVSSYRQSPPPAQPKGRLARGYALWPGW